MIDKKVTKYKFQRLKPSTHYKFMLEIAKHKKKTNEPMSADSYLNLLMDNKK